MQIYNNTIDNASPKWSTEQKRETLSCNFAAIIPHLNTGNATNQTINYQLYA